jgi:GTP-binding protein EngB required for normal cell division
VRRATSTKRIADLGPRLDALEDALGLARDRLDAAAVDAAEAVLQRSAGRLRLGPEMTVVALAGATGSGKSSLFNALAGADLSAVGVRRPTTGRTVACVWGEAERAAPLLDWLGATKRHYAPSSEELDGLVLLDLPDHDSTHADHRHEVDRLVALTDLFVWVVDPQKYADALLHERYLQALRRHSSVLVVALNHVDALDADARRACIADLHRLLAHDGLWGVPVLPTSARTGEGIPDLERELSARVSRRRAAAERIAADLGAIVGRLEYACSGAARRPRREAIDELTLALADAAGVETVVTAVARSHRRRSVLRVGSPLTRWVRGLRPDPLGRLHLDRPDATERSSLGPPAPVQGARVGNSVRVVADETTEGLADPWPRLVRGVATRAEAVLPDHLERAVAETDLGMRRNPRWWALAGALQALLAVAVLAGALWLLVLFGIAWLRLPDPPTPEWRDVPLPTLLFLGGIAGGFTLAALGRAAASVGARRRAASARRRLLQGVARVARDDVIGPITTELDVRERLCTGLRRARGS